jgi:hypothetical protein
MLLRITGNYLTDYRVPYNTNICRRLNVNNAADCCLQSCIRTPKVSLTGDIRLTSENIRTKEAQTWTQQKETNAERRESFVLRQTHFSVNNDMK